MQANVYGPSMFFSQKTVLDLRGPVDRCLRDPEHPRKKVRGRKRKQRRRLREAYGYVVAMVAR